MRADIRDVVVDVVDFVVENGSLFIRRDRSGNFVGGNIILPARGHFSVEEKDEI